jgi:hypothetical protein
MPTNVGHLKDSIITPTETRQAIDFFAIGRGTNNSYWTRSAARYESARFISLCTVTDVQRKDTGQFDISSRRP